MFRFEKLDAWQKAIELSDRVYTITRAFPVDERFGLTMQMRRAATSIAANIAEGTGRASNKDYAHYVSIAYGSLMETVSHAHVARRQDFLKQDECDALFSEAERLARMLSGLRASLLKRGSSQNDPRSTTNH